MSEFGNLLKDLKTESGGIEIVSPSDQSSISFNENTDKKIGEILKPFDIKLFSEELKKKSEEENERHFRISNTISGYSIAHDCILCTVKKILNYPVPSFAGKWLPLLMRSTIGTAVHDFIQSNSSQFTEIERSMKVPSIRFSGRLDALRGRNVLVEIKTCSFSDYQKILKKMQPRTADFYQTMTYKYILENHLEEAKNPGVKTRTAPPELDKYEIDTIQFIYIAHDLCAADIEDIGEEIENLKVFKRSLNSKANDFYFMTSVVLDMNSFDNTPYMNFVKEKMDAINYFIDNNKLPGANDKFIDTKQCFFCLYKDDCELLKK